MSGNTGIPVWRCASCGGHDTSAPSIPEGIDFAAQVCEGCGLHRTAHNANGCMAWCCCVCEVCSAGRAADQARWAVADAPGAGEAP